MLVFGVLVEVDAALRAQAFAVGLAQRLQRQAFGEGVAQQGLEIGEATVGAKRVGVFGFLFSGDDVGVVVRFVFLVGVGEERGDVGAPVVLQGFEAAGALRVDGGGDVGVEYQAVHDGVERSVHMNRFTFGHADNGVADSARGGEVRVHGGALPRS